MSRIDFDAINAAALADLPALLRRWIGPGIIDGDEFTCGDFNGGKGRSVRINVKTGKGGDFAANMIAGDPIGIYALVYKVERVEAARAIAADLGLDGGGAASEHAKPQHDAPTPQPADDTDAEKIAKVQRLLSECTGLRGTPAEAYLRARGIRGAPPGVLKWWPDRRRAGYGAMVCIALNGDGEPVAIQRIFLTPDGQKDTSRDVVKRSNGVIRGSAMMLPARQPDTGGPLLLTEGPEDGLSLWCATGLDVAVGFGIFALRYVPIPDGRPAIFVRDNDPPGSDADKATARVTLHMLEAGTNLLMTRPPDGIKDSNDLLRANGADAVVDMVNSALPVRNSVHDATEAEDTLPAPPPPNMDDMGAVAMPPPEFQECSEYPPTDTGNAQRIVKRWGSILMYAPGLGWHIYRRGVWDANMADMRVLKMAQVTAQDIQQEVPFLEPRDGKERLKWATKAQMGGHISYAINLTRPYVARSPMQLDADPWLFNAANGVVDLRTGLMQDHSATLLMTKQAPVEYRPDAKCPTWERFLREIFAQHADLIPFIQRAVGYSLSGSIAEQCMFIAHGYGSNGKSTFLETLQAIIGPYWAKTQAETFAAQDKQNPGAPNPAVAALRGARFVTASETNEGLRLNEGLVKEVTGDAFITVRKLHQEPFTFQPSFKLWLGTNHKPEIRGTDHGIWRRIHLLPFDATFYEPGDADAPMAGPFKDKTLPAKLRGELPGILAWAIRGARQWHQHGLGAPQSVLNATLEYRNEMDVLGAFVSDAVEMRPGSNCTSAGLYDAYKRWAADNGHGAMSKNKFGRKLRERGFKVEKDSMGNSCVFGVAVRPGFGSFRRDDGDPWHQQDLR